MKVILHAVFLYLPTAISFANQEIGGSGNAYGGLPGTELNLFWSSLKVVMALFLTLLLLVAGVWLLKRFLRVNKIPGISGRALAILEIRYITPKKAIALVRVLQRVLIVGVSENSLNMLGELTSEEIERLETNARTEPGIFKNILAGFTRNKENDTR